MRDGEENKRISIFCCYAHTDKAFLDVLKKHLQPLLRQGVIDLWCDTDIGPGAHWDTEIHNHLEDAHIILLLISADFMDSDYCYSKELRRAMELHFMGKTRVVPIILRPILWSVANFGILQALPTNAIPVVSARWNTQDDAFLDIVEGIRRIVEELTSVSKIVLKTTIQTSLSSQTLVEAAVAVGNAPPVISRAILSLESLDENERRTAVKTLGQADHPVAREALIASLQHVLRDVRLHAASYVSQDHRAIPLLIETLYLGREYGVEPSDSALVKLGKFAVPALIEALETNNQNQLCIIRILEKIGDIRSLSVLVNLLRSNNQGISISISETILKIVSVLDNNISLEEIFGNELGAFLHCSNRDIRLSILAILGKLSNKAAHFAILEALHDEDELVRLLVTLILTERKNSNLMTALQRNFQDKSRLTQLILTHIWNNPDEKPLVLTSLRKRKEKQEIRLLFGQILGRIAAHNLIYFFDSMLHSSLQDVRLAAIENAREMGSSRAYEFLVKVESDGDKRVDLAATRAISEVWDASEGRYYADWRSKRR